MPPTGAAPLGSRLILLSIMPKPDITKKKSTPNVALCQNCQYASPNAPYCWRIRTPSATGYYEVAAQARPMMMLAETCIIGGTVDGYSHLGIAEREDTWSAGRIMRGSARWRGSSTGTGRPYPARSGGTADRALQDAATARLRHRGRRTGGGSPAGAPGSWTSPRGARWP